MSAMSFGVAPNVTRLARWRIGSVPSAETGTGAGGGPRFLRLGLGLRGGGVRGLRGLGRQVVDGAALRRVGPDLVAGAWSPCSCRSAPGTCARSWAARWPGGRACPRANGSAALGVAAEQLADQGLALGGHDGGRAAHDAAQGEQGLRRLIRAWSSRRRRPRSRRHRGRPPGCRGGPRRRRRPSGTDPLSQPATARLPRLGGRAGRAGPVPGQRADLAPVGLRRVAPPPGRPGLTGRAGLTGPGPAGDGDGRADGRAGLTGRPRTRPG